MSKLTSINNHCHFQLFLLFLQYFCIRHKDCHSHRMDSFPVPSSLYFTDSQSTLHNLLAAHHCYNQQPIQKFHNLVPLPSRSLCPLFFNHISSSFFSPTDKLSDLCNSRPIYTLPNLPASTIAITLQAVEITTKLLYL